MDEAAHLGRAPQRGVRRSGSTGKLVGLFRRTTRFERCRVLRLGSKSLSLSSSPCALTALEPSSKPSHA